MNASTPTRCAGSRAGRGGDDSPRLIVTALQMLARANPARDKLALPVLGSAWSSHGMDVLKNFWTWGFVRYRALHTRRNPDAWPEPCYARPACQSGPAQIENGESSKTTAASTPTGLVPVRMDKFKDALPQKGKGKGKASRFFVRASRWARCGNPGRRLQVAWSPLHRTPLPTPRQFQAPMPRHTG